MTSSTDDLLVDASAAAADASAPPTFDDIPMRPGVTEGFSFEGEPVPPPQDTTVKDLGPKAFDPKWREPFQGLMYLGHLEDTFSIWGHSFHIATPSQLERLQIGLVHKPYAGSLSTEIAFETAMVAAYLVSIDGQELPKPVTMNTKDSALQDRYNWVLETVQRPVISKIYEKCLVLEEQVDEVLRAMGEA